MFMFAAIVILRFIHVCVCVSDGVGCSWGGTRL